MVCSAVLTTAGIGAEFPFLMTDIISHAPQEQAGSAASLAQTANELGITATLTMLLVLTLLLIPNRHSHQPLTS